MDEYEELAEEWLRQQDNDRYAANGATWLISPDDPRHVCNFRGDTCDNAECGRVDEEFRDRMNARYDVWMAVPGSGAKSKGFTRVADAVCLADAQAYERTSLHKIHVERSKA